MTTPFTSEDMMKRGIFSSIIGLRINKTTTAKSQQPAHNPWQEFDESQQPCSTWRLQQQDQLRIAKQSEQSVQSPHQQRTLSHQLENTFLASPQQDRVVVTSPNDIFQEILCECAPFEQFPSNPESVQRAFSPPDPWFTSNEFDLHQNFVQPQPFLPQQNTMTNHCQSTDQLVCPNCLHSVTPVPFSTIQRSVNPARLPVNEMAMENKGSDLQFNQQWRVEQLDTLSNPIEVTQQIPKLADNPHQQLKALLGNGNMSIEELVKVIVSTVKDSGILRSSSVPVASPTSNESPEEILRRKRQQNNEAAARYRRRQKEAKMTENNEIEILTERNRELRDQIYDIQKEMSQIRNLINK